MSLIDNLFRVKLYRFLRLNANSSLAGIYFAILRSEGSEGSKGSEGYGGRFAAVCSLLPQEGGGAVRRQRIGTSVLGENF